LNGTHQFLVYADNINMLRKKPEALLEASMEVGMEVNRQKTKNMLVFPSECKTES